MTDKEENEYLFERQIERDAEIVKALIEDPALFARVRKNNRPFVRRMDLIERAESELARMAMDDIFK